jgi:hypothetical protein
LRDNIPTFNCPDFWKEVSKIVKKYKIDFIYPASPLLFDILDKCIDNKLMEKIVLTDFKAIEICRNKLMTYAHFRRFLYTPALTSKNLIEKFKYSNSMENRWPIFIKPKRGQGSQNCFIVNNKEELDAVCCILKNPLCLQYIDGPEYTVDCFTDRHGKLRFVGARIRSRIKNGISVNSSMVDNDRFKPIAEVINSNLKMRGGWFFQVKGNDSLCLLEIEPRIAGTSGIWRQVGVNLPLLTLYDRLGQDVEIAQLDYNIELDRALKARFLVKFNYDHVYVDLDDTLIINDSVNTKLMAFLYQSINDDKQIYLVTRNDRAIELLKRHSICRNLFAEINVLNDNTKKSTYINHFPAILIDDSLSTYINHFPAILIDDSFGERQEVKQKLNIPVFDLDAVECLIN